MNASIVCVVCCDEDNHVVFSCLTPSCEYRLCSDCIKFAFQDGTGKNSEKCPSCNEGGNAIRMVKAVVGPIGVRAVENELRSTVEFDVKERLEVRKVKSANLSVICDDARRIFNELTEEMNLKCPRCKQAFYDYDGCNALYCGSCECRFCAICLKDCGSDAHPHVRAEHGNLFDKEMFNASKAEREKAVVQRVLKKLQGKPDELKQLVKNHLDKAGVMAQKIDERVSCNLIKAFLGEAKESLRAAVRTDRLSLLSDGSKDRRREDIITSHDISPRCAVPDNYRLKLLHQNANVFLISLEMRDSEGNWAPQRLENSEKETKCADDKQTTPIPDCLTNLTFSLKCAVVAIKGRNRLYQTRRSEKDDKKDQDRISIGFTPVDSNGDIAERNEALPFMHDDLTILGLNPNLRINLLNEHVQKTEDEDLISDPIRHVIGAGTPCPLLENMHTVAPETLNQLNELQRKVAHPLCVKSAMEVAGPPGTGKTKTITELTRSLLECTDYGIIVLSERNGAIDAIAEKFASNCLVLDSKHRIRSISDVPLWLSVMTYGSASVGSYTKMFTLKEKMIHHPELVALRAKEVEHGKALDNLAERQRRLLSGMVLRFGDKFDVVTAKHQAQSFLGKDSGLNRPNDVITQVENAAHQIKDLLPRLSSLSEDSFENFVNSYEPLFGKLWPLRQPPDKKNTPGSGNYPPPAWTNELRQGVLQTQLIDVMSRLTQTLSDPLFDKSHAETLLDDWRKVESERRILEGKLQIGLVQQATLMMSTIGSSHQLPYKHDKEEGSGGGDDDGLVDAMAGISLDNNSKYQGRPTVVIFDEAGCIPSYELLGLSRLGCIVKSLILVGDVHQLPPYDPGSYDNGKQNWQNGRQFGRSSPRSRPPIMEKKKSVKSLLSVSTLTINDAKVQLTMQYRVPRDIAALLNSRIYNGKYETPKSAKVPNQGFRFIHVPFMESNRRKYVNDNEVDYVIRLVRQHVNQGNKESIMVLTPYKNQQREIQFHLKREEGLERIGVLTIDQCQGQEADIVILSLVRKPTRFLDKNRMNVALSRVRQMLYFLVDRALFAEASQNSGWDCGLLAKDLLRMGPKEV